MQMSTAIETDNGEMIVKRVSVPIGLEELMEGLTKEVILKKPKDIYVFASEYFARLLDLREKGSLKGISGKKAQSITKQIPRENGGRLVNRKSKSIEPIRQLSRQTSIRSESPMKKTLSAKKLTLVPKEEKSEKTVDKAKSFLDKRKARKGSKDSNNGKQSTDTASDKSEKKTPRSRERSVSTGKQPKNEEDNIKMPRQRSQSIKSSSSKKSIQKSSDSEVVGTILKQTPSLPTNKSETSDNTQSLSEEKDIDEKSARSEDVEMIQKTPSHEDKNEEVETCIGCSLKEEGAVDLIADKTEKEDLQGKEAEETTSESTKPDEVSNTKNDEAVLTQSVDKSIDSEAITGSIDEVDSGIDVDKTASKLRNEQSDEQSETSKTVSETLDKVSTLGTTENHMEKEKEVEAVGNIEKESSAEIHISNKEKIETSAETAESDREDAKLSTDADSSKPIILPDKKEEEEKSVDPTNDGKVATQIQPVEIDNTDKTVENDVPDKEKIIQNETTSSCTEMENTKKEETPVVENIVEQKDNVEAVSEKLKTNEEEKNKNQENPTLEGNNVDQLTNGNQTSETITGEEEILKKSSENSTEHTTNNETDKKDMKQEENIKVKDVTKEEKSLEPNDVSSDKNKKLTEKLIIENIENNNNNKHLGKTPRQIMKASSAEHAETQDKTNKVKRIKSVDLNKKNTLVHTRSKDKLFLNKAQDGNGDEVPKQIMDIKEKKKIRCKRAISADVTKEKDIGKNVNNLAHRISFDSSKLQDELKEASKISKETTFKTSYNPYKLRQEIKEASQNTKNEESDKIIKTISDVAAAIKIQSTWRGFKVRRQRTSKTEMQQHAVDEVKSAEETTKQLASAVINDVNGEGKDKSEIQTSTPPDNIDERKRNETKIEADVIKETKLNEEMVPKTDEKSENATNQKPSELSSDNQVNANHENKNEERPSKSEDSSQLTIKEDERKVNEGENKDKKIKEDAIADAVLKIQALWRGFKVRKHLKHAKLFGTAVEAQDKKQEIIEPSRKVEKAIAVSKIQAFWRGYKVRKNIKEVNKRLDALQKPGECDEMPNQRGPTDEDIFKAASKIQAGVRGYMTRKKRSVNHLNSIEEAPEEKLSDEQVIQALEGLERVPDGSPIRKRKETHTEKKNIEETNTTKKDKSNEEKLIDDDTTFSHAKKLNVSNLQKEIEKSDEKFKKMVASSSSEETTPKINPEEEGSSIDDSTEIIKKLNVSSLQKEIEKSEEKFKEMVASSSREETTPKKHSEEERSRIDGTTELNKSQLNEEPKTNLPKEISDSTTDQEALQTKIHDKEESLTENTSNEGKLIGDNDTLSKKTDKEEEDVIPNTEDIDDYTPINKVSKTETIQSHEKENKEVKNEPEFIPSELNSTTTNKLSDSDTFAISDDSISNNTVNKEEIGPVSFAASNEPSYEDAPTRPVTSDIMLENTNNQMISDKTEAEKQNKQSDDSENIDTNSLKNVNEKDKNTINEENIKTLNKINKQLSQGQSVQDDDKQELISETCKQKRLLSGDSSTSVDSAATVIFNDTSSRDDEKIRKEDETEEEGEKNVSIESNETQSKFNIQSTDKKNEKIENKDDETSCTKQEIQEDEKLEKTDENVTTKDVIKSQEVEKVIEKKNVAGNENENFANQQKKSEERKTESVIKNKTEIPPTSTELDLKNQDTLEAEKSTKMKNESLTGDNKEKLSTETEKNIEAVPSTTEHTKQILQTDIITGEEKKESEVMENGEQKPLRKFSAANEKLEEGIKAETKNDKTETNVEDTKKSDDKSGSFDMSALRHEIASYGTDVSDQIKNEECFANGEKAANEQLDKEDVKKLNVSTLQKEIEKSDEKFKKMVASSSRDEETTSKMHPEEEENNIGDSTEDVKKLNVSTLQSEIEKTNERFKEMVVSGSEETTPKIHPEEERSSIDDSTEEPKSSLPKEISDSVITDQETHQANININNTEEPLSMYIPLRSLSDIREEDSDAKSSERLVEEDESKTDNVQNEQEEEAEEKLSESSKKLDASNTSPESGEVEKNLGKGKKENLKNLLSINSENGEVEQKVKDSANITVNLKTGASPEAQEMAHEIKIGQQENVQIPAGATINLVHSGEFHDTVISVTPPQRASTEEDHQAQNRQTSPQGLVNTGELHDNVLPVSVHLNEAPPAGVEVLTSLASKSINNDGQDRAQASNKDASTCEAQSDNTTSSPAGMDTEKRNNASIPKKSMEIEAATKIQAGFRGYQVRKQLKNKIGAPGDISNQRRSARRKNSGRLTDSGRISKSKTSPSDIEEKEKSAVKIQAGVRGFLVRRRQKKQKQGKESA